MVVDACEADVLERRLAQILKEAVLRRLRCNRSAANVFEKGPELVTGHADLSRRSAEEGDGAKADGSPSRAFKCLTRVDFKFC